MSEVKNIKADGNKLHMVVQVNDENETWAPVVYGNTVPDSPHPLIMVIPMGEQQFYLVVDNLSKLARVELRPDRVFETMEDAIEKSEELANDHQWIADYEKYVASVVG